MQRDQSDATDLILPGLVSPLGGRIHQEQLEAELTLWVFCLILSGKDKILRKKSD